MVERNMSQARRWTLALGSSVAAMAAASAASPAAAQCAPDPTIAFTTTDCTGTDTDGLVVPTSGTRVTVASGATVGAGSGNAPGAITLTDTNQVLTVNGLVDGNLGGNNKAGIAFYAGPRASVPCDPDAGASIGYCPPGSTQLFDPWVSADLIVGGGATVTGAQAVLIAQHPQNETGNLYIGIANSGTLTGTQGPAIVNRAAGGSLSIVNESTGLIEGIVGQVDYVRNEGTIDGGTGSAIAITGNGYDYGQITNRGSIVSTGDAATLSSTAGTPLYVENEAGAAIGGAARAIFTDAALMLDNAGTIRGSVVSTGGVDESSTIDTRLGTIEGDVTLGAGEDTVFALFDAETRRIASITGKLDGGAGIDTLNLDIGSDATFGGSPLPTNFERLGLDLADDATVTLDRTFTVPSGIALGGVGSLINQADLATSGPAIAGTSYSVSVTNQANITATLSDNGEAAISGIRTLVNSGTITAQSGNVQSGNGVEVVQLDNTGTITATGTAAYVTDGGMTNAGSIVSTGGTALELESFYTPSVNTGTIRGATNGVILHSGLTNSGTIAGGVSGVVMGSGPAMLLNESGGIVEGGISSSASSSSIISNAGTITGSVNLIPDTFFDYSNDVFVDAGGTVDGAILLGGGDDLFVVDYSTDPDRPFAGATGGVDAGDGYNTLRTRVNADAAIDIALVDGFQGRSFEVTNGAALTLRSADTLNNLLGLTGNGTITLEGALSGTDHGLIDASLPTTEELLTNTSGTPRDLTIVNGGTLSLTLTRYNPFVTAIDAARADVVNNGAITMDVVEQWPLGAEPASAISYAGTVTNTGTIATSGGTRAISFADTVINSGTITGTGQANTYYDAAGIAGVIALDNSGTIRFEGDAVNMNYSFFSGQSTLTNSGTIESLNGTAVSTGSYTTLTNEAGGTITGADLAIDIGSGGTIANRGAIAGDVGSRYGGYNAATFVADGGTVQGDVRFGSGNDIFLQAGPDSGVTGIVDGGAGRNAWGYIYKQSADVALTLAGGQFVNFQDAAVVALGTDTVVTIADAQSLALGGNVRLAGSGKVVNTATITGQVSADSFYSLLAALGEKGQGLAAFENQGTLAGGFFGTVSDFANSGSISGLVSLNGDQLTVSNSGNIAAPVWLSGEQLTIGNSGAITGSVELSGGQLTVDNSGAISAPVWLSGEQMTVANSGTITGDDWALALAMSLRYPMTEGTVPSASLVNSGTISGAVAGVSAQFGYWGPVVRAPVPVDTTIGASVDITNTATGVIAGGQNGIAVANAALTLDNAGAISGGGDDPVAVLVTGSAGATIRNRGTIEGAVQLADGDDSFTEYAGSTVTGGVDGGAGVDLYRVVLSGDRTGIGARTGFEQLAVEGSGTLTLALDQNFQSVSLAGANLAATLGTFTIGRIDGSAAAESLTLDRDVAAVALGAGDDRLTLSLPQQTDAPFNGTYDGGEGYDTATLEVAGQRTLASAGVLIEFERLQTLGSGVLALAGGAFAFDRVDLATDLTVASGASLAAPRVDLGEADTRLIIAGTFAGSVAGGTGDQTIEVSGNAVFAAITDVEALRMSGGLATVSGEASLGAIALSGGRLVGLAGSTITAPTFDVARGATFGSAGTVNGNVTVAGTLSPGASPGTMTVNGNVALAGTSVSVFEITPTVSDKLVVNGSLAIAQGATLQIVADQAVRPGQSLDLITTTGGITGSFTTILKPASLFGFVVQRDGTISLLGQFLNDARYSGQVRGAIDYVNAVLAGGTASATFVGAVPALLTPSGAADQAAFARLTPEAYASAGQIAVEQGLELAATGRSAAFAPSGDLTGGTPSAFTFASALGSTRTLEAGSNGTARARTNGYGFAGGLGIGGGDGAGQWSLGAFVGYLDSRQVLAGRGARTDLDGIVAGVHGRWTGASGLGIKATIAYSGGNATTRRTLPGSNAPTATGKYDLTGWTGDISVDYAVPMGRNWTVRPGVGLTAIRTTRDAVAETGGSAFALAVAKRRDDAVFVDGALTFRGGMAQGATVRPFLSLGVRYQLDGRTPYALAALGGGGFGLQAAGAQRARLLATATVGADVALTERLSLFGALSAESGDADNRASARTGLRLAF